MLHSPRDLHPLTWSRSPSWTSHLRGCRVGRQLSVHQLQFIGIADIDSRLHPVEVSICSYLRTREGTHGNSILGRSLSSWGLGTGLALSTRSIYRSAQSDSSKAKWERTRSLLSTSLLLGCTSISAGFTDHRVLDLFCG